jgi:hypothetical protein
MRQHTYPPGVGVKNKYPLRSQLLAVAIRSRISMGLDEVVLNSTLWFVWQFMKLNGNEREKRSINSCSITVVCFAMCSLCVITRSFIEVHLLAGTIGYACSNSCRDGNSTTNGPVKWKSKAGDGIFSIVTMGTDLFHIPTIYQYNEIYMWHLTFLSLNTWCSRSIVDERTNCLFNHDMKVNENIRFFNK